MISHLILGLLFQTCTFTVDINNNVIMSSGCTANDIFVNAAGGDFRLKAMSPAIGFGACLPEVTEDFDGVPRPNRAPGLLFPTDTGCDIGAFQFPVQVPSPPTNVRIILVK